LDRWYIVPRHIRQSRSIELISRTDLLREVYFLSLDLHATLALMNPPDIISSYEYKGQVDVEWYDVPDKESIPDLPWHQVYALGNLHGKVPVVYYSEARGDYNLPGGKTEPGESIEETIKREVLEETNLIVCSWEPLGYQVCTNADTGNINYQFRVYAELRKEADFVNDPGGGVLGHELVDLAELNKYINYGKVGTRLVELVQKYFAE